MRPTIPIQPLSALQPASGSDVPRLGSKFLCASGPSGQVLTAQDPQAARGMMDAAKAQSDRQAYHDAFVSDILQRTNKAFGIQLFCNSGDETGTYSPAE